MKDFKQKIEEIVRNGIDVEFLGDKPEAVYKTTMIEALYQLHLEGVREIIGEMQDVLNEKYIEQIPQYKNITPVEIDIIAEAMREKLKK